MGTESIERLPENLPHAYPLYLSSSSCLEYRSNTWSSSSHLVTMRSIAIYQGWQRRKLARAWAPDHVESSHQLWTASGLLENVRKQETVTRLSFCGQVLFHVVKCLSNWNQVSIFISESHRILLCEWCVGFLYERQLITGESIRSLQSSPAPASSHPSQSFSKCTPDGLHQPHLASY